MADTRIVLQQRLSQQLVMTPQLRQAIKILQVSRAELETLVDQELTENPVLEEQDGERTDPEQAEVDANVPTVDGQTPAEEWDPGAASKDVAEASSIDQIDWREYAENYSNDMHASGVDASRGSSRTDDDERRPGNWIKSSRRCPRKRARSRSNVSAALGVPARFAAASAVSR
jgi:RNA polymerase sigma-54 factor